MKLKNKLIITLTTLAAGLMGFQQVDAATVFDHLVLETTFTLSSATSLTLYTEINSAYRRKFAGWLHRLRCGR